MRFALMQGVSRRRRILAWAAVIAVAANALAVVFTLLFAHRLIFMPTPADKYWAHPAEEDVPLTTADGTTIVSWHRRVAHPRATFLVFHGSGGNASHRTDFVRELASLEADVFVVGYHGYGKSGGSPTEAGFYQDADAAYAYVERGKPVVILGESLGGAPAIDLASRNPCAGLVLLSPFTSIRDMAYATLPVFPAHWFIETRFDNLSKVPRVAAPTLFIVATDDEVVPCAQTRRLFEATPSPKTWLQLDRCGHNDMYWQHMTTCREAIAAFLDRILK